MRILCCFGQGEPEFSSAKGLAHGFRELGVDVVTCGPAYWDRGYDADIPVPDRPHPERYSYREILKHASSGIDFILQVEPHFYLTGDKPHSLKSGYYITDPHRAGALQYRSAIEGQFDHLFIGQPHFAPYFDNLPMGIHPIGLGFDTRRFDQAVSNDPTCDIVFIGQSGIANMPYPQHDEYGQVATEVPDYIRTAVPQQRYAFSRHPGYDYAERAEFLIRLMHDFDVRLYDHVWDADKYQACLQQGRIGFNRSLLGDIGIRCYEVMAAHRPLVTDVSPFLYGRPDNTPCQLYPSHFKPFFDNFDLEYGRVFRLIEKLLTDADHYDQMVGTGTQETWRNYTWTHRAHDILSAITE